MEKSLREHSRTNWTTGKDGYPGDWNLLLGCLQRIADATEKMALNYTQLQKDNEWYERENKNLNDEVDHLKNSRAGYKAALTKIKKSSIADSV